MFSRYKRQFLWFWISTTTTLSAYSQNASPPVMGWSSWNSFHVDISEQLIKEQADAMVSTGMGKVGYQFINVDDGYLGGRDSSGNLFLNAEKFPSGMRSLTDYIHNKGLKAGIYTDAGKNTCGSIYDNDIHGIGVGLYGNINRDLDLFFRQWNFNFIKVDWCGGKVQKLNPETEYSRIIDAVRSIDSTITFNLCMWQFPGTWAIKRADSWRISEDIRENFQSVLKIIDLNRDLAQYASPGHYNDMDMLQVGRGMSYDEDRSHFSMWCMMNSPLMAGNDLRYISKETISILTNEELIALNQDKGFKQATRVLSQGSVEVWLKPLGGQGSSSKAIAIFNRGEKQALFKLNPIKVGISKKSNLRDLWEHRDLGTVAQNKQFTLPKHGIIVLRVD
ncbi:glycoside hydrolase family 27 protein [Dyadobacter sp. CY312]|uniref:glycoside hydrolase family 27 protein n=1 Tax=Dyadobacter sp. CY312 TaxID=2907303 RepID=UPI001F1FFEB4|nr:glycoside hydrolase family 27 protein [Dyadobacter sp. CY312]MCE7044586.1 glycoside hydrolase family 27 protein [Dyadobacter sp. CY312]